MKSLEVALRALRENGTTALVPYFMAGATPDWIQHVAAAVHGGANAVEIGIPFSDPMMDGPVIQRAAERALAAGTTLESVCTELSGADLGVPLIAMTYYNLFHHRGLVRSTGLLSGAGVRGAIVPDLTIEESQEWREACAATDIATIFLVAPSTTAERFARLAAATEGFCYASARMAVTGRAEGGGDAQAVVASVRATSDVPTYVGIGITTARQAHDAARFSDGIIVGSALVETILNGATPADTEEFVSKFRHAIDQ
ncbi:MAG: tryptophan synthase subunit alpha [Acidobacteriota bacterium]|nr:tryptophan synthase subunit alpha [Acidobacteriota bacterium]MDE3092223.1 tryptophan synthase subunit alpha [Acidobacteriota bacterium]